jgi:Pyridine nucleotide-disulphide oxidoreductase
LVEIHGDTTVTEVLLRSSGDGTEEVKPTSAVFTAVGRDVDAASFCRQLAQDRSGRLKVDSHLACSIPGVFAAGAARSGSSDQLAAAMGDGTTAGATAVRWWQGEIELSGVTESTGTRATQPHPDRGSAADSHHRKFRTYADYLDEMELAGKGDGFPLVPPTPARIETFLAAAGLVENDEIGPGGHLARDVAMCAVAAGCRPDYAGIAVASVRSLLAGLDQTRTTLADATLPIVINGPVRLATDMNCSDGLFGPGWRANATLGRAVRLYATHVLGIGAASGFGDPGQYTLCIGEDEEKSPWAPLHVQRGFHPDDSTATVFPAAIYRHMMDRRHTDGKGIVDFLTLFLRGRASGTLLFGDEPLSLLLVIAQEQRRHLTVDYSKEDLRTVLFERITADDGTPFAPLNLPSEDHLAIVAAGGVAQPSAWVFTSTGPPPVSVRIEPKTTSQPTTQGDS